MILYIIYLIFIESFWNLKVVFIYLFFYVYKYYWKLGKLKLYYFIFCILEDLIENYVKCFVRNDKFMFNVLFIM